MGVQETLPRAPLYRGPLNLGRRERFTFGPIRMSRRSRGRDRLYDEAYDYVIVNTACYRRRRRLFAPA